MRIKYSYHAQKRMKQRGITSPEIEFILKHPDYIKKSFEGRKEALGHLKGQNYQDCIYRKRKLFKYNYSYMKP